MNEFDKDRYFQDRTQAAPYHALMVHLKIWVATAIPMTSIDFLGALAVVFGYLVMMVWNSVVEDVLAVRSLSSWRASGCWCSAGC